MSELHGVFKPILLMAIMIASTPACSKSPETKAMILIERMHQLAKAPTLTLELIRDTLEVDFTKDEAASHDMVTFFIGTPRQASLFKDLIKLADCRVPTSQNTALREPFLVVELQSTGEVLLIDEVFARFGRSDSLQPSLPEDQTSSASYIYKAASRSLWITTSRQAPDRVLDVSIHALEDAR